MKKILIYLLCAFSGLTLKAQIPQPDPDTTAKHFLIVASIGNLQEAGAGQLAVQKAKNLEIKAFGQMMIKDHGEAEQKLSMLAESRRYSLPPAATGGIQPDLNLVNAGDKFDKLYVHDMLTGLGNAVQTFEAYAVNGKDQAVRSFAQQRLPILKAHLAAAKALNEKMKLIWARP